MVSNDQKEWGLFVISWLLVSRMSKSFLTRFPEFRTSETFVTSCFPAFRTSYLRAIVTPHVQRLEKEMLFVNIRFPVPKVSGVRTFSDPLFSSVMKKKYFFWPPVFQCAERSRILVAIWHVKNEIRFNSSKAAKVSCNEKHLEPFSPWIVGANEVFNGRFVIFGFVPFGSPQWGAADSEIKVPSGENTELKRSPFKAWSRSVYGHVCCACCQGFLPC